MSVQTIDQNKLDEFMGRAVNDMGAAMSSALSFIGDQLGLYKAMDGAGPLTAAQLAKATGTHERYIREWLSNQAAGGYVTYDAANHTYTLPEEQAMALAREDSPAFVCGGFQVIAAVFQSLSRMTDNFRSGEGLAWGDQHPHLFAGTERFFKPSYRASLINEWIPALDGVAERLQKGITVADVGCGHGASTVMMAEAFPNSRFTGFDFHAPSIETARERAKQAGVSDRVDFQVARSNSYPGSGYGLVTHFDCLHDMADPTAAAAHVLQSLADDGTFMIVEPLAGDHVADNLHPIGRVYYAASTLVCVPASLAEGGVALGAQAGEGRLSEVLTRAGFTRVRRACSSPFNMVLEARK